MKFLFLLMLSAMIAPMSLADGKMKNVKSTTLEFSEGSSVLNADQKEQIRSLIQASQKKGEDMNVGIAAWSDQPFPAEDTRLSEDQRDLAQARLNAIEEHIATLDFQGSVDTFNMAKSSNWLARLFNTEESELKSAFAKKDVSEDVLKSRYEVYRKEGDARKAVVVLSKDKGNM